MINVRKWLTRWAPALLWMAAIFGSSATPAAEVPTFGVLDYVVKKSGHFVAYGILALTYRRGLGQGKRHAQAAWLLAVLYALSDELHQSFVAGRHPALMDALIFDAGGALAALVVSSGLATRQRRNAEVLSKNR